MSGWSYASCGRSSPSPRSCTSVAPRSGSIVAQPSVSQQIRTLEQTLGVRLFERNRRGVTLTPAGEALLEEARDVLASRRGPPTARAPRRRRTRAPATESHPVDHGRRRR